MKKISSIGLILCIWSIQAMQGPRERLFTLSYRRIQESKQPVHANELNNKMERFLELVDGIESQTKKEYNSAKRTSGLRIEELFKDRFQPLVNPSLVSHEINRGKAGQENSSISYLLKFSQEDFAEDSSSQVTKKRKKIVVDDCVITPSDFFSEDEQSDEFLCLDDEFASAAVADNDSRWPSVDDDFEIGASDESIPLKEDNLVSMNEANIGVKRFSVRLIEIAKRRKLSEEQEIELSSYEGNDSEYIDSENEKNELIIAQKEKEVKKRKKPLNATGGNSRKKFVCDGFGCNKSFNQKYGLQRHKDQVHKLGENFFCDECLFASKREDAISRHKKLSHKHGISQFCDNCEFSTRDKPTMKKHKKTKHDLRLACIPCKNDIVYCSIGALTQHILDNHPNEKICFCGYGCRLTQSMRRHKEASHSLNVKCNSCDKCFISRGARNQHAKNEGHSRRKVVEKNK